MHREELEGGLIRLLADNGVKDIRTDFVYSEVICKPENEKYYVENEG